MVGQVWESRYKLENFKYKFIPKTLDMYKSWFIIIDKYGEIRNNQVFRKKNEKF